MATWACGSCGGENPEGMSFCGHCGAQADALWTCAACGGENVPATGFCGHCGAARSEVAQAPQEPERDVADALRSFVAEQVADVLIEAGDKLPEERRLITALFADVSGFTSLADRLDPEQLLEVIDPVISGLSSVVGRYGGYVEKFAGDALMALFGAPVSHDDDAARALRVALEMHDELERIKAELPADAAGLTLKGKSEPVPAWRLVGERATASRPGRARMVGRDRELDLLAATTGGVVTITGEPGVGKSRLLEEARALAAERGIRWL